MSSCYTIRLIAYWHRSNQFDGVFLEMTSTSHRKKSHSITMSWWCGRFRLVCANHFVAFRGSPRSNNSADSFVRTRSGGSPGDGIAYGSFMVSCSWLRERRKSGDEVSSIAIIERWIAGTPKSFKCIRVNIDVCGFKSHLDIPISLRRHWNGSFRGRNSEVMDTNFWARNEHVTLKTQRGIRYTPT